MKIRVREQRIKLTGKSILLILHPSDTARGWRAAYRRGCVDAGFSRSLNPGRDSVRRMDTGDRKVFMKLRAVKPGIMIALLMLAPSLAFARPRAATAHVRLQSFRDRAPKARMHDAHPRQTHVTPSKVQQPAPPQKDDF